MGRKGMICRHTYSRGLRVRAWWVLRNRKSVTLNELLDTLADGHEKDAKGNLGLWLRALERVGILRQDGETLATATLHLARDCGDKAPVWRRSAREVFIPGSGEVIQIPPLPHPPTSTSSGQALTKGGRGDLEVDHV